MRATLRLDVLALCLCLGMFAVGCRSQATMPDWTADHQFTVPFELITNHILIPVTINNQKLSFIFDTGDKYAIVDSARARALGLKMGSDLQVHGAGEKTIPGNFVKDEHYGVAGLWNFSGPVYLSVPLNDISAALGRQVDGIVGSDLIRLFVVEIDYAKRKLIFHDRDKFSYTGSGIKLPIEFDSQDHPVVTAQLKTNGRELPAGKYVVDLGANTTIVLNTPFVNEERLLEGLHVSVAGTTRGTGGLVKGRTGRVDSLRLGNWTLPQPYATFSQDSKGANATSDVQGYIGTEIMRRFRLFLDYAGKNIILEPTEQLQDPFPFEMSGLVLQGFGPDYKQMKVISVAEESPGSEAGIKPDDVLVAIDGQPTSSTTLADLQKIFRREGQHDLDLQRGETRLRVTLKLRPRI